jgi:hypothetical protein
MCAGMPAPSPHCAQYRASGESCRLHLAHVMIWMSCVPVKRAPQARQKRAPGPSVAPHALHRTGAMVP